MNVTRVVQKKKSYFGEIKREIKVISPDQKLGIIDWRLSEKRIILYFRGGYSMSTWYHHFQKNKKVIFPSEPIFEVGASRNLMPLKVNNMWFSLWIVKNISFFYKRLSYNRNFLFLVCQNFLSHFYFLLQKNTDTS